MRGSIPAEIRYLCREVLPVLNAVCAGFTYDPGCSDLDNEQPINVRMTLGDYRRARRLQDQAQEAV